MQFPGYCLLRMDNIYANIYAMQRTTVYIPKDIKLRLAELADRQRVKEAELIRRALRAFVEGQAEHPSRFGDFRSGLPDLAERADEYLDGGFGR